MVRNIHLQTNSCQTCWFQVFRIFSWAHFSWKPLLHNQPYFTERYLLTIYLHVTKGPVLIFEMKHQTIRSYSIPPLAWFVTRHNGITPFHSWPVMTPRWARVAIMAYRQVIKRIIFDYLMHDLFGFCFHNVCEIDDKNNIDCIDWI